MTRTCVAGKGEMESTVRMMPVASQGWRPLSVTIQPLMMATKPSGQEREAMRRKKRFSKRVPRSQRSP